MVNIRTVTVKMGINLPIITTRPKTKYSQAKVIHTERFPSPFNESTTEKWLERNLYL